MIEDREREDRIREKFLKRLEEALDDDKKCNAAVLGMAAAWLDGKGRKGEREHTNNPYDNQLSEDDINTARAATPDELPPVDLDGYDRAIYGN